jgi:hypothetical protein
VCAARSLDCRPVCKARITRHTRLGSKRQGVDMEWVRMQYKESLQLFIWKDPLCVCRFRQAV